MSDIVQDQTVAPEGAPPAQPEAAPEPLILGKFKTTEDLAAAYKALEAKLGARSAPPPAEPEAAPEDEPAADPATPPVNLYEAARSEFTANGELSKETLGKLANAGIPPEIVQSYIQQQAAAYEARAHQIVGGPESFQSMMAWAAANLDETEKAKVNAGLAQEATFDMAVQALYAKYQAAAGDAGGLITDKAGGLTPANDVFRSTAEMTKAMADPQYKTDPAYRQAVAEKLARSRKAGSLPPLVFQG